jgi:hypothetical protein
MPLNPNILLQARGVDLATPLNQSIQLGRQVNQDKLVAKQSEKRNELTDLQIANEKFKSLDARQQQRLKSSIIGAAQLDVYLQAGDLEGADKFLAQREVQLKELGMDTNETTDARRRLRENPEGLKVTTGRSVKLGEKLDFLKGSGSLSAPAAIQIQERIDELRKSGNKDSADLLERTAKINPKGFATNPVTGRLELIPEFAEGEETLSEVKERGKQSAKKQFKAPDVREINVDGKIVTQEFDRDTGTFKDIAERTDVKAMENATKEEKAQVLKKDTLRIIDDLLADKDSIKAVVGPFDSTTKTILPKSSRAETKLKQLISILTAENLDIMTGVLSETDLKVIADIAGGGLDMSGDDDTVIEELERLKEKFSKAQEFIPTGGNIGANTNFKDKYGLE